MNILVGTAGFSYKDREGIVYPVDLKKRKIPPLQYLAQFYDCCELNTSFYGPFRPSTAKQWCAWVMEANPNFVFTAKLYKAFTHSPVATVEPTSAATIRFTSEEEKLTREGFDSLAEEGKLGAVVAQFPISFKNTDENREYLQKLIAIFRDYPLAIEVRRSDGNDPGILREFTNHGVAFVNVDQPLLGRALRGTAHVTGSIGYVRLHGRNYQQWFAAKKVEDRYNFLYTADRCYEKHDAIYEPRHYLPLLEQKTNALDQAAPLADWQLPEEFARMRRLLESRQGKKGKREYVQILRLLEHFSVPEVQASVQQALQLQALSFDAVKHLVLCRIERKPPRLDLGNYPHLPATQVALTAASDYLPLLAGGAC